MTSADICNIHGARGEAWRVFGLETPPHWPDFNHFEDSSHPHWQRRVSVLLPTCDLRNPVRRRAAPTMHHPSQAQFETGQMLVDKERAWAGLVLAAVVGIHHQFFMRQLIYGDCAAFDLAFNATDTAYALVHRRPVPVGRVVEASGKAQFFSNTMAQRSPDDGRIVFLHRGFVKFWSPSLYPPSNRLAWQHTCVQVLHCVCTLR